MRSRPVPLEILGVIFADAMDGQTGGVGGHQRSRLAHRFHALEKLALDFQILGHGFDNPIRIAEPRQVVFEIARGDQAGRFGSEKSRGPRLPGRLQARRYDAIAHRGAFEGQPVSFFLGRKSRGMMSSRMQGMPAFARCAAMRAPIVPAPSTAAFSILRFICGIAPEFADGHRIMVAKALSAVNRKGPL